MIVTSDAPSQIRYISAIFKGEADVKWRQSKTNRSDGELKHEEVDYKGHEDYFEATYFLIGGVSQEFRLPPGEHVYNFSTTLPPYIPPSFESKDGHIRYTLKVKVHGPHDSDHEIGSIFTVLSHVDLNKDLTLKEPASRMGEKTLCCLCCASGPLTLVASVPSTGFVCGQDIPITVEIENGTNKKVKDVICSLIQSVCFTAGTPEIMTKTTTDTIKSIIFEPVDVHDSKTLMKKLKIPTLPPSKLDYCDIIDIKYSLDIEAVISGPHINLHVSIPITLGTIPLLTYVPSAPYPPQQPVYQPFSVQNSPYQQLPPASYEECQYRTSNFQGTYGANIFIPRYPTYNLHV